MRHLTMRVAWHDSEWNGRICAAPSRNAYCIDLERIRAERDDAAEDAHAAANVATLHPDLLPPCQAESGLFMNPTAWTRVLSHPYARYKDTQPTHGKLQTAKVIVPPYSTFAVPFAWMLAARQEELSEQIVDPLPPDSPPPFRNGSSWVFSGRRQTALLDHVFGQVTKGRSLALLYTKSGHPLGDHIARLVVGVGTITAVGQTILYPERGSEDRPVSSIYPAWDRVISHSIRPDGADGLLLPYHAYLAPTGDPAEDAQRRDLLDEIIVAVDDTHLGAFSYGAELAGPDVALATLVRCLDAVRIVRRHGIAEGPWEAREDWLNARIADAWTDRGAFPGAGAALEALGLRMGTSLVLELQATKALAAGENPWPLLAALLEGRASPPRPAYSAPLRDAAGIWRAVSAAPERRAVLELLSRFDLTVAAATRWFRLAERAKATRTQVSDDALLANPYRISETDLGDEDNQPVPLSAVDLGMFPDDTIAVAHPLPATTPAFGTTKDQRRVRAGLVEVLRRAEASGDTLLSADEVVTRLAALPLSRPLDLPVDWLAGNTSALAEEIELIDVLADGSTGVTMPAVQLSERRRTAGYLVSKLGKRAAKTVPSIGEDWRKLLIVRLKDQGVDIADDDQRAQTALTEQAAALERITTRRLSVLVGRAGTGKTTVLGALQRSRDLQHGGMLFLAPTGKATVRLTQKTGTTAFTVAQFLHQQNRYDGIRQRPLFAPTSRTAAPQMAHSLPGPATVVIDECSMLTEDDLRACLEALDLGATRRLILVGDPNQLPPIGPGRPFADLVAHLDACADEALRAVDEDRQTESDVAAKGEALARLTVELRSTAEGPSEALRLASWYTSEQRPVDADEILDELDPTGATESVADLADESADQGTGANTEIKVGSDLRLRYWTTVEELEAALLDSLAEALGLASPHDVASFNAALGLTPEGWVPFGDHSGAERFQVLSPVRMAPHGVHELNRLLQRTFRGAELAAVQAGRGIALGPERIVDRDKVILLRNGNRTGWHHGRNEKLRTYLANGEVGLVSPKRGRKLSVAFAAREQLRFEFGRRDLPTSGGGALELAYALTVHKAQGSEFDVVLVIVPATGRLMSRELIYTALTRAKSRLVLLVEGHEPSGLFKLASPEHSETARRNTNLFTDAVRQADLGVPFAHHLVHRTDGGLYVRSKSELIIAQLLENEGVPFRYEPVLRGEVTGGYRRPDFTFASDSGDTLVWEHLGMLERDDYRAGWHAKRDWYKQNNFIEGQNLFTSREGIAPDPGLKMSELRATLNAVLTAMDD